MGSAYKIMPEGSEIPISYRPILVLSYLSKCLKKCST